jgi:asparaginyl-tRNA synthetase
MLSRRAANDLIRFSTRQQLLHGPRRLSSSKTVFSETPIKPTIASLLASRKLDGAAKKEEVTVEGFIRTIRKQKRHAFAEIGDGSTAEALQVLMEPAKAERQV